MTTSVDLSVDELLLLQENQYQMPNITLANIKPIGAERKIGQPTRSSSHRHGCPMSITRDIQENNHYWNSAEIPSSVSVNFSTKLSTMSTSNPLHFSTNEKTYVQQINKESKYRPFSEQSPRLSPCTMGNYNYQQELSRITERSVNPLISTRITPSKTIPSFSTPQSHSTSRFLFPHNYGNPFSNRCQPKHSLLPAFTTPFQCTRERFQVNSIGRPILRTNNYNHSSSAHGFKVRR